MSYRLLLNPSSADHLMAMEMLCAATDLPYVELVYGGESNMILYENGTVKFDDWRSIVKYFAMISEARTDAATISDSNEHSHERMMVDAVKRRNASIKDVVAEEQELDKQELQRLDSGAEPERNFAAEPSYAHNLY